MKKELELKLVKKYPNIFKEHGMNPRESAMGMGICCGQGWYNLIDELCNELQVFPEVVAAQVKEKFGGLRFYTGPIDKDHADKVYEIIAKYESRSIKTCELCGKPGKRTGAGWVRTLCKPCEEKRDLSLKITNGSCKYKILNLLGVTTINIYDEENKAIFSGEFQEFMDLMAPRLALEKIEEG